MYNFIEDVYLVFYLLVPNSLDISKQNGDHLRKKKRRRKRPNEGMADFSSTYELTNEHLGEGAWSKVTTCIHRRTNKAYAVKVSLYLLYCLCFDYFDCELLYQ